MTTPKEESSPLPQAGVGRRGFLVMVGSVILGRFNLPEGSSSAARGLKAPSSSIESSVAAASSATGATAGEAVRKILTLPTWGEDRNILVFAEEGEDGEPEIMAWRIDNEEERAEAERFDAIIRWKSWQTTKELRALLAEQAMWLIRWNLFGNFKLLSTVDPTLLFGEDEAEIFTLDVAEGALFPADEAYDVIMRMEQEYDTGGLLLFRARAAGRCIQRFPQRSRRLEVVRSFSRRQKDQSSALRFGPRSRSDHLPVAVGFNSR